MPTDRDPPASPCSAPAPGVPIELPAIEVALDQPVAILQRAAFQFLALGERVPAVARHSGCRIGSRRAQPVALVGRQLPVERLDAAAQEAMLVLQLSVGRSNILGAGASSGRQHYQAE